MSEIRFAEKVREHEKTSAERTYFRKQKIHAFMVIASGFACLAMGIIIKSANLRFLADAVIGIGIYESITRRKMIV